MSRRLVKKRLVVSSQTQLEKSPKSPLKMSSAYKLYKLYKKRYPAVFHTQMLKCNPDLQSVG